jgi:predicted ester cyclase
MTFVQIIDCRTDRLDDMNRLMDAWVEESKGKRTATHSIVGRDRADGAHVVEIIEFPSYEEAMRNSKLPETNRIFEEMVALCDGMPTFTDLDVVRDEQLNKTAAARVFREVCSEGNLDALDELLTEDYRDHDPVNPTDTRGPRGMKQEIAGYRSAFDVRFEIENQLAEGDEVATRWTVHLKHTGEFMGVAPTGKAFALHGTTTFRFRGSRIQEGWWDWDGLGMLRNTGVIKLSR